MAFAWDLKHWRTIDQFKTYLRSIQRPSWCIGIVVHNTLIPTVEQWRGASSMVGMRNSWEHVRGWSSGPQIVVATDGVWQATPVTLQGVHAGVCNGEYIAMEVVGNYNKQFWQDPIKSLAYGTLQSLADWLSLTPDQITVEKRIRGHCECMDKPQCPGKAVDLDKLRRDMAIYRLVTTGDVDISVLGVQPSIDPNMWRNMIGTVTPQLSPAEVDRIYTLCQWLDIDPLFVYACAKEFITSEIANATNAPIPITAPVGERRPTYQASNTRYYRYESWQIGYMSLLLHLKNIYGAVGNVSVRRIVPSLLPNGSERIPKIVERMRDV